MVEYAEELLDDDTTGALAKVFAHRLFKEVEDAGGTVADTLRVLELVICSTVVDVAVDPRSPEVENILLKNVREMLEEYRADLPKPS